MSAVNMTARVSIVQFTYYKEKTIHIPIYSDATMNEEEIREYILSLPCVTEDQPFGDDNITFRIGGKIFLCLSLSCEEYNMRTPEPHFALKLTPERNEELREQYPEVSPAWHWNKKHWSDIHYTQLNPDTVRAWMEESYRLVLSSLPKKIRDSIQTT